MDEPIINTEHFSEHTAAIEYAFFREKGIELLQKLSGQQWTDHNIHDPGITILEQLCYALTDLSYRIGFSIPDLMAEGGERDWSDNFRKSAMLGSGPVNLLDWRKLLIDTDGVRNAWIFPIDTKSDQYDSRVYFDPIDESLRMSFPTINRDSPRKLAPLDLRGLYRVVFIPEFGQNPEQIKNSIRRRLHERRNLCEDFHQITALSAQEVQVEAKIEIGEVSDPAGLLAQIYFAIQNYLSSRIRFYTLQERLESGQALEDILDGPILDHGFLDDDELEKFQVRRSLRISDIIRLVMGMEGVRAVQSITLSLPGSKTKASTMEGDPWELWINKNYTPMLIIPGRLSGTKEVGIKLEKNGLAIKTNWNISWDAIQVLNTEEYQRTTPIEQDSTSYDPIKGRHRQVSTHQSIQHQFPEIYGIGVVGLPPSVSPQRMAQARQFKSYLAIFDQLLANAFSQLGGVGKLFSLTPEGSKKTYFSQSMREETPGLEDLIRWRTLNLNEGDPTFKKNELYNSTIRKWTEGGDSIPVKQSLWERRSRLLNHLLSRFGEEINEHDARLKENLFHYKEAFLNDYARLSKQRGKAFDYTQPSQNTENISGLERRLSFLLGFPLSTERPLGELVFDDLGGFYLIEHILLRPSIGDKGQTTSILKLPISNDKSQPPMTDPFSLQLSFIFPGWLDRFDEEKNPGFRLSVIKTLREETPAHIRIFVQWLNKVEMQNFEVMYHNWIDNLKAR